MLFFAEWLTAHDLRPARHGICLGPAWNLSYSGRGAYRLPYGDVHGAADLFKFERVLGMWLAVSLQDAGLSAKREPGACLAALQAMLANPRRFKPKDRRQARINVSTTFFSPTTSGTGAETAQSKQRHGAVETVELQVGAVCICK